MKKSAVWGLGLVTVAAIVAAACSPAPAGDDSGTGGDGASDSGGTGSGGKGSGGKASGGSATGGKGSGGTALGGADGVGGSVMGGTAGANLGGQGGETAATGGAPACDAMVLQVAARDDTNSWGANDFDDVELVVGCPTSVTATWPHEADWDGADPSEANSEGVHFSLTHAYSGYVDLTGKTVHAELTLVDDGRGPAAENGGYTVYLAVSDNDWTEAATSWSAEYTGQFYGTGEHIAVDFVIPAAADGFDPAQIRQLTIRVENKTWDGPVFDYDTSVMSIDALSVE